MKKISCLFFVILLVMSAMIYADTITENEDVPFVEGEEVIGNVDILYADEEEIGLSIENIEVLDKEEYLQELAKKENSDTQNISPITMDENVSVSQAKTLGTTRNFLFLISLLVLTTSSIYIIGSGALEKEDEKIKEMEEKENVE